MGRFKRCAGCLHAYYCSQKCQRYDWKNGKHKQYCMRIHQRFVRTRTWSFVPLLDRRKT